MAKFSGTQPATPSPIQTIAREAPDTLTHEGGTGWTRDAKGELFLLALHNFVAEQTFYEDGKVRDKRFAELVHAVAGEDPGWLARFVPYLRGTLHMRSASVVMAVEAARAIPTGPGSRSVRAALIDAACQRADEPAEALGYYMATNPRPRVLPNWLRVGLAKAAVRLYDEFAVLQYDGQDRRIRMADVLELCHTPAQNGWRGDLFRHILDRRHGHDAEIPGTLGMLESNRRLRQVDLAVRRSLVANPEFPGTLKAAGFKWSDLDGWLQGPMDSPAWQAVIPSMGYMALLRNLRNFDAAGVPDAVAVRVAERLADPEQVARSRQLPFRFYSAYKAVQNDRWRWPIERALQASLTNIPSLGGRTLILVDDSPSMRPDYSFAAKGSLSRAEQAALFGAALALRAEDPTVVVYSSDAWQVPVPKGGSVLRFAEQIKAPVSNGTNTLQVLVAAYAGHDRVVILTDEQAHPSYGPDPTAAIRCPIYTWNLAGYQAAHLPSGGNRHTFGGLTDSAFSAIAQLEARQAVGWPF